MKKTVLALAIICILVPTLAVADESDIVTGKWLTQDNDSHVLIYQEKEKYRGKIIWLKDPLFEKGHKLEGEPATDEHNPDPKLQDRAILGLEFVYDFVEFVLFFLPFFLHFVAEWRQR